MKKGFSWQSIDTTDLLRTASVLLPARSIVPINQKAICDAALNPQMSKMGQMMITWGKSMMITPLLMVPPREQHPSTHNSGKIHRQRRSSNLELALCRAIHLITGVWRRDPVKKKQKKNITITKKITTCICYLMPLLTSKRKKTEPALSHPVTADTVLCENSWWVRVCSIGLQRENEGR